MRPGRRFFVEVRFLTFLSVVLSFAIGFGCMPVYRRVKLWEGSRYPAEVQRPLPRLRDDINRRRFTLLEVLPARRIVFLGDSRIAEGEWGTLLGRSDVENCGLMGDTVTGVSERLATALRLPDQWCILEAGFNDLSYGSSPEAVAGHLAALLRRLTLQFRAQVVLCSILPAQAGAEPAAPGFNARVQQTNALLATLSFPGVRWLDLTPRLCRGGGLDAKFTNDGTHLFGPAYLIWCDALARYLPPD